MERSGSARSKRAASLARNANRTLVTILLANMVVNVSLSVVATSLCLAALGPRGLVVAIPAVTIGLLLFGEIVPKSVGLREGRRLAEFASGPLDLSARALGPVRDGLERLATFVSGPPSNHPLDREELGTLVMLAEGEGELTPFEAKVLGRILEFTVTTVEFCLTPRVSMACIEVDADEDDMRRLFDGSGRSRVPVYEGTNDQVVGILFLKDLMTYEGDRSTLTARDLMREPYFVPETVSAGQLFADFQARGVHIAIVVGEHGGVEGLVTLEDLLEEIVGDIRDESDEPAAEMEAMPDGSWRVPAITPLDELSDALGVEWSETDEEMVTLGGLLQRELERVPAPGDELVLAGLQIRVLSGRPNRPLLLSLRRLEEQA